MMTERSLMWGTERFAARKLLDKKAACVRIVSQLYVLVGANEDN